MAEQTATKTAFSVITAGVHCAQRHCFAKGGQRVDNCTMAQTQAQHIELLGSSLVEMIWNSLFVSRLYWGLQRQS